MRLPHFKRLVDTIYEELPFFCAYLDDIVTFSNDRDEHLEHILRVLSCLRQAKVKLNLKKCEIGNGKIQFSAPSSAKDVQRFIGTCVGYQKFIKNFSEICLPLYDLTKKNNVPRLSHIRRYSLFQLKCDALHDAMGYALSQFINEDEYPITFGSNKTVAPLPPVKAFSHNYRSQLLHLLNVHERYPRQEGKIVDASLPVRFRNQIQSIRRNWDTSGLPHFVLFKRISLIFN
ncbi:hypothetical protein RF11_15610 [Thelohanellus kitauei]|uniref:Reverse transcriptase domain-containing protein n=1 Tax=Thelohanellus kitauei TaxID=669202 RepID=A0A0C2JWQ4_THEKT|nr:hypothetical protein RF11_15610 [Thelohanellus kitauei]